MRKSLWRPVLCAAALLVAVLAWRWVPTARTQATPSGTLVATGQRITPTAAPGSFLLPLSTNLRHDNNADGAYGATTALSPDGSTLLVLTTGYNNSFYTDNGVPIVYPILDPQTGLPTSETTSNAEWVFVYDVRGQVPKQVQKINIPLTYNGLAWDPSGKRFYVSGGVDDMVYVYRASGGSFVPDGPFVVLNTGVQLENTPAGPALDNFGLTSPPVVAGVAVNQDGSRLYAANFENDSVSIVDTNSRQVLKRVVFSAPGHPTGRGEYPFWIAVRSGKGPQSGDDGEPSPVGDKVFVSSQRDSQIVVFDSALEPRVIRVGSAPNKMLLSQDGKQLFVANGDGDSISVIDTDRETVTATISLKRNGYPYTGANPNSLALGANAKRLYVTLGGENAVAVIDLNKNSVIGRIPAGWYPNSVTVSADGSRLFVVNSKGVPGPNPSNSGGAAPNPTFRNEYVFALEKASLLVMPVPSDGTLEQLSQVVDANNGFNSDHEDPVIASLRGKIKHIIYIVKENRTYDQVLGDLPVGNGDPQIVMFPQPVTPNHHKLAMDYVTLDNFYVSGEGSGEGWNWSTQARINDYDAKAIPPSYGNGFGALDVWATSRNIVIGMPDKADPANQFTTRITTLLDPTGQSSILPGPKDIGAGDGDGDLSRGALGGYLWDEALRSGVSLRHYGFYTDYTYYSVSPPLYIPISRTPFASNIPQGPPLKPALRDVNDVYYRGFDLSVPDRYHYEEWKREFDQYVANGNLPALEIMSLPLDHFGSFGSNVGGLNTPTLEIADNDYALARMVEAVSHSAYWKDTAIFVLEDDAQDGPDHVDAHRSPAYLISAYTKRNAVVDTYYTTVNMMRTMEDILGLHHLSMNTANADPMSEVFALTPDLRPYDPVLPAVLCAPPVDPKLIPECADPNVVRSAMVKDRHDGAWWQAATNRFNFSRPDALDNLAFNRVLWKGIMGEQKAYPTRREGR